MHHMNARGQGHFKAVSPCTTDMVIYINFVSNIISATSFVQDLDKRGCRDDVLNKIYVIKYQVSVYRSYGPLVYLFTDWSCNSVSQTTTCGPMSFVAKINCLGFNQVAHTPVCSASEASQRLQILEI